MRSGEWNVNKGKGNNKMDIPKFVAHTPPQPILKNAIAQMKQTMGYLLRRV